MKRLNTEKGSTLWSTLFVVGVIVIIGLMVIKLAGAYTDGAAVRSVLNDLSKSPEIRTMTRKNIKATIIKRLKINNVRSISKDDIEISFVKNQGTIDVNFEVRVPMVSNVDAVVSFENHVEFIRGS